MKEVDLLVVGQGLAGTWLSYYLQQAGLTFCVIDSLNPDGASLRAAGLINPVTGRRMVTTWMIDELMPFASMSYRAMEKMLRESFSATTKMFEETQVLKEKRIIEETRIFEETEVIDFFPGVQMLQAFQKRYEEDPAYLEPGKDREKYAEWFRYDFGWGSIRPCYLVAVEKLLSAWRSWLKQKDILIESSFDLNMLDRRAGGIHYAGIDARYIIFCDGKSSAANTYFEKLPFAMNKGEGLLVEIKGLPPNRVFKKGMSLVPYRENIFWLGSSYEWEFKDDLPSNIFRIHAENWLKHNLKLPYRVMEHFAALRPATLERRPFVGIHPLYPQIGILNGLGTKGCSLAPYFANQLVNKIKELGAIDPLADIKRFEKVLGR